MSSQFLSVRGRRVMDKERQLQGKLLFRDIPLYGYLHFYQSRFSVPKLVD